MQQRLLLFCLIGLLAALVFLMPSLNTSNAISQTASPHSNLSTARTVQRISQLDGSQYGPPPLDVGTWWEAACSAAAITEVLDAWGDTYHIRDILAEEVQLGVITPRLGLLETAGITRTAQHFGFTATILRDGSLSAVIERANQGHPIIVNIPANRAATLYPGGHFLVVEGGTGQMVYTADSSRLNLHVWNRTTFQRYYAGLAIDLAPNS